MKKYKYDIALSYASEKSEYVEELVLILKSSGLEIYHFNEVESWGKNSFDDFSRVFIKEARFAIMFISKDYVDERWTNIQRKFMQSRAFKNRKEYILPARFDDTEIPGLLSTISCISINKKTPKQFSKIVLAKVRKENKSRILQDELKVTDARSFVEGLKSPKDWFLNWRDSINEPVLPPTHWLLDSVFIKGKLYDEILKDFLNGKSKAGITGFYGMGGVGKTYTALKISWELIDNHNWKVVWVGLLQQGTDEALNIIAEKFNLYFSSNIKTEEKVSAIRELFKQALKKFPKMLVVLDNAENFPRLDLLIEGLRNVPVLVTSRKEERPEDIPYKNILPLKRELGIEYSKQFLKYYNIKIDHTKNDDKHIPTLCEYLGGHPLGIRLALSRFVKKSKLEQLKTDRFLYLIEEMKKDGVSFFTSETVLGETLDEKLHKSIETTFSWSFKELGNSDSSTSEKGAHLLLPIMAVAGTTKVTKELFEKGINLIITSFEIITEHNEGEKKSKNNIENKKFPDWILTLKKMQNDKTLINTALSILVDLSLVEVLNADDYTFALHPLIREFAIHYVDSFVSNKTYYTSDNLFRMAIQLIGQEKNTDVLIDLLPRLKKNRQLIELAIKEVKNEYDNLYFNTSNKWPYLIQLLEKAQKNVDDIELTQEQVWIRLKKGELLDRIGDEKGLKQLKEGIDIFIKKEDKDYTYHKYTIFDWIFDSYITRHKIVWACSYLMVNNGNNDFVTKDSMKYFIQVNKLIRDKNAIAGNNIFSIIRHYTSDNEFVNEQLGINQQGLLSNTIINLTEWLIQSIKDGNKENVEIAKELFNNAIEKTKTDNKVKISIEQNLYFQEALELFSYEYDITYSNHFEEKIQQLKNKYVKAGIRTFHLEMRYCLVMSRNEFIKKDWTKSLEYIKRAKGALAEIVGNNTQTLNEINLYEIANLILLNKATNYQDIISDYEKDLEKNGDNTSIPLLYFAKACLFHIKNDLKNRNLNISLCEIAYYRYLGNIPPFVRPLINEWKDWSIQDSLKIDDWKPWIVDYSQLPERVKSKKDSKIMRLVKPGFQWSKSGKEIWMFPFYVDEEPLTFETISIYCKKKGLSPIIKGKKGNIISFRSIPLTKYMSWVGKTIPSKDEIFASWLQLEKNIKPELWSTKETMIKGKLNRIKQIIEKGEANSIKIETLIDDVLTTKERTIFLKDLYLIDKSNKEKAQKDEVKISDKDRLTIETKILPRFRYTTLSKTNKMKLATLSFFSISLTIEEKEKIYKRAEELNDKENSKLSRTNCFELIKIFEEEKIKFAELEKEYGDDVHKLRMQRQIENDENFGSLRLKILKNWNKWNVIICDNFHTDKWTKEKNNELIHKSFSLTEIDTEPIIRGIIPIYTKNDLDGLIPI